MPIEHRRAAAREQDAELGRGAHHDQHRDGGAHRAHDRDPLRGRAERRRRGAEDDHDVEPVLEEVAERMARNPHHPRELGHERDQDDEVEERRDLVPDRIELGGRQEIGGHRHQRHGHHDPVQAVLPAVRDLVVVGGNPAEPDPDQGRVGHGGRDDAGRTPVASIRPGISQCARATRVKNCASTASGRVP